MPMPRKADPAKDCAICGTPLSRKRYASGLLETRTRYLSRQTCGQSCGNSRLEVTKAALHIRARKFRASACAECGATAGLHVHHVDRNPANNDPANLLTLCGSCHLKLHWREDREQRMKSARRSVPTPSYGTEGTS